MDSISDFLKETVKLDDLKGRIGDDIEKYERTDGSLFYLKTASGYSGELLRNEMLRLSSLKAVALKVPQIEYFYEDDDTVKMAISSISGKPAHEYKNILLVLEIASRALHEIHSLDIGKLGIFADMIQEGLDEIAYLVKNSLIDTKKFCGVNNKTPGEIYKYLVAHKYLFKQDTFTHGDYCLPNIIIDSYGEYGIVDWGQAGISDKYRDFAAMEVSINKNFGSEYIPSFYQFYGLDINDINRKKINYFHYMDQFQYHKKGKK